VIDDLSQVSRIIYLKEDGVDVAEQELSGDLTFVISDHQDLAPAEEQELLTHSPATITLGPLSYHADHCIIVMHNELDRRSPVNPA
jgi:tRNA (pseudouridine54-N1)-methyltransferase